MNLEGKLLGNRYEILENIGNGGMALVYKAKDQVLNRNVAVKILRDEFTTDEEFIKRFSIEAQAAASITHPNIVSVYDVGKDGNLYFIVMELIQGKTLKEIIVEEHGALPWKWSVNIAIQIASALETAHKKNIIHRDIKPHNIIITEDGVAKVTDFGIAKAVSNSTITAFGATIGSVHYFSPEHAKGGFTDSKSDIYSLGIVMYEMLTGRVPFDADTPVSVALKHMQEEAKPPIELNPKIPAAVNDIIMKAIRKDTTLRYQSATEMLNDLNRALKNPTGNFVDNSKYVDSDETIKIPTMNHANIKKEQPKKKQSFIEKHKKLSIVLGGIGLFIIALLLTILILKITNPKEVILPNLVGIEKQEAENILKDNKLKLGDVKEEYNSEIAEGYIISQDPPYQEDFSVKEGTKVSIIVSLGIEETTVPKVVGMKQEEAIEALEAANLKYEIVEESSKKVEEGYVIEQETAANKKIYAGDTVVIHVSTGIKKISVPSVVGKTQSEAKKELQKLGLKVIVKTKEDNSKTDDIVLEQDINEGTEVEEDSFVTITVNKKAKFTSCALTIRLESLLKKNNFDIYTEDTSDDSGDSNSTNSNKQVAQYKIDIYVDGVQDGNGTTEAATSTLSRSISGSGIVRLKITADSKKIYEAEVDLNKTTKLTIK